MTMDKKLSFYILFCISFLIVNTGFSIGKNQNEIDSLVRLNQTETNPEKLIDNYNEIANLFSNDNIDSAYFFVNKALDESKKIGYVKGQAEAYYLLSYFNDRTGKLEDAIDDMQNAITFYTELGDSSYLVGCYNNLGVLYSYGTDQKTSLEYFIIAMNLAEAVNETFALSEVYANIGSFYEFLKEYGSALKYYNKALEVDLKSNNQHNIALSYITVGSINIKLQRYDIARDSLFKAQNLISQVKDNYRLTELYINLADYFIETNQLDSASNQILLARETNKKDNYDRLNADILAL